VELSVDSANLLGFVLGVLRASAWVAVAPPFNAAFVPARVKIGLAAALGLAVAPTAAAGAIPTDTASFVTTAFLQVAVGITLGFLAQLLLAAAQAAGSLIDLFGGFTLASAYDPLSLAQTSIFGRSYQLFTAVLLFATNGHLLLVRGFMTSFSAVPVTGIDTRNLARLVTHDMSLFFLAAVEIAAPLIAALFLADVALGLLARATPQLNPMMMAYPLKILMTLMLVGLAIPFLPNVVHNLLTDALRSGRDFGRLVQGG
jgi:flagellar biosynthetic protein FliR